MKKHKLLNIKIKKETVKRIVSLATALVLLANSTPLPSMLDEFHLDLFSSNISVEAYSPTAGPNEFTAGTIAFNSSDSRFTDYCYYYSNNRDGFAKLHQDDIIELTEYHDTGADFMGLGNADFPFRGTLKFSGTGTNILNAPCAIFTHVYDSARLMEYGVDGTDMLMQITRTGSNSGALIAEHVYHDDRDGATFATWKVEAASGNTADYSGVIGEMHDNANVTVEFANNSGAVISANGNVGLFCGKMDSGSILNVTYTGGAVSSVTSANANAGGLVGVMESGATLTVNTMPSVTSVTASKGYAGGLVGDMQSTATITYNGTIAINTTIEGGNGAGGLYGHLLNTGNTQFDISSYSVNVTLDGLYAGGLIGVLENGTTGNETTTEKYEITDTNYSTSATTVTSAYKSGTTYTKGYYGGMIGKYTATDLSDELHIHDIKASSNSQSGIYAYGGAVGLVDSVSYVKAESVEITAKHSSVRETNTPNYAFFGGIIGATNKSYSDDNTNNSNAVFVDVGNFTLTFNNGNYKGGGIVGQFYKGVLRLSGTTDLRRAKTEGNYNNDGTTALRYSCYGQLVGYNDDVLVYAADGWSFTRCTSGSIADDLGTWGEVVRGQEGKAITYDDNDHNVTVAAAVTNMSSADDFVKTALNIQLNDDTNYNGVLIFSGGSDDENMILADKKDTLLAGELSLGGSFSLAGTGINGLMRDGIATGTFDESDIGDVGVFTGTFDGNGNTITLAIGEKYATNSGDEGNGEIYRHRLNGLFAVVGGEENTAIKNVKIAGTENIRNAAPDGMTVGGVAARVHGSVKLEDITAQQTINYYEKNSISASSSEALGKNLGGVAGYVDKTEGQTISVTGINTMSTTFNFSGNHNSWLCYGALIGKIVSTNFTVDIAQGAADKLTASYTMNGDGVTSNGSMADGGGLIGYITRNSDSTNRKVNIKNTEFKNSTDLNIASTTGGGLLGFAWLDTDVTIDGITTTGATINSTTTVGGNAVSTQHVGALTYMASGVWTVNSLNLSGLTVTGGATKSLGMLVNRAYDNGGDNNGKDSNNHGLYIDLLKSGYTLTGATIPVSTEKFDEIAAYTAETKEKVLQGGDRTGIISINMNSNREGTKTKVTETGTYQNQLSSVSDTKYPNNTARYYYNLDKMSSSDNAQDVMLWSVNKYAASNLKSCFTPSNSPLNKENEAEAVDVNLSGYSFYPVYKGDGVTVKNINFTFDYSGILAAEGTSNTDSYIRDPGHNGTDASARNQHFLMQSGLFITVSEGSGVKFDTVKLSGNFLEIANYQGVLVSDTAKGDITINGIELNGIVPKTTGGNAYTNGYMLINKVKRDTASSKPVTLSITNVSTTDEYTTDGVTAQVTKSLFGTVEGPAINITLSAIKLDSRTSPSAVSDVTVKAALDKAYGTVNSIFTDSTLFASIKTTAQASLIYNYNQDEDHGKVDEVRKVWVTYGKEINATKEYLDGTTSKQLKYYEAEIADGYTNPLRADYEDAYDFSTGFLPYVKTEYDKTDPDSNGSYFREIAVNVHISNTISGCGTYNDPYVITDGDTLEQIADFMSSGSGLPEIILPKTQLDGITNTTKGNRWCTDNDAEYTYDNVDTYTSDDPEATNWTADNVRLYLENAYYKISGNIELSDKFAGLGGNSESDDTGKYAFRGVIIGNTNAGGEPTVTITNNSQNPLINISNGCVVKNLNIVQNVDVTLDQNSKTSANAGFGYTTPTGKNTANSGCWYYGGFIGEIMGGDNIIDNCYVTQATGKIVNLKGNYGMLCPVGSYVGVVVYGGLVFKNINDTTANANASAFKVYYKTNTTNNLNDVDSKGAIYVNPFVGRVINGYAVNETTQFSVTEDGYYHDGVFDRNGATVNDEPNTHRDGTEHTLKNTTKHYTIADIKESETAKLDVSNIPAGSETTQDGEINIPNSQAFFILSLITQSGSGTAQAANGDYQNSLSYGLHDDNTTVRGMSHTASYDLVGQCENIDEQPADYYQYAAFDTAAKTAVPYIIEHYTVKTAATGTGGELVDSDYIKVTTKNGKNQYTVTKGTYNARYVTSTKGYYDINLTNGTEGYIYQLPDSFRGLGCVGRINTNSTNCSISNHPYNMKVDVFDGNNATIDEDIYLNRFHWDYDNYFDTKLNSKTNQSTVSNATTGYDQNSNLHGIGLFNTVYMRSGTYDPDDPTSFFDEEKDSQFKDFTLTGSVKIETYKLNSNSNATDISGSKVDSTQNQYSKWLSCGGVVGHSTDNTWVNFNNISLNGLSVYGATVSAGLLGSSVLGRPNKWILINECSADNLSLETVYLGHNETYKPRDGIGGFVGRVWEGGVKINGGTAGKTVTIKKACTPSIDAAKKSSIAAGLIAYAGNGCTVLNMTIKSADENNPVTIGNENTALSSAVCGLVQPSSNNPSKAWFDNVHVENINLKGVIIGSFLAGTTASRNFWYNKDDARSQSSRTIFINNCSVVGDENNHNTITASIVAGGFVGDGTISDTGSEAVPNITIHNCRLENYDILNTANNSSNIKNYSVGGFIGYAICKGNNRIVCSVYDSSIENCTLGDNTADVYTGAVLGNLDNANNSTSDLIAGYNIKLDSVTTDATSNSYFGTWIGRVNGSNQKSVIQFVGLGIYDCSFPTGVKNVANGTTQEESFVYADYDNTNESMDKDNKNKATYNSANDVDSPNYPYVNVNPQSAMGVNANALEGEKAQKVISGDGAVLRSTASGTSAYSGCTAEKTMALKLYEDLENAGIANRYTIFSANKDEEITTGVTIEEYFKRTSEMDGDRISTYRTERGTLPAGVDDFACIVIANTDDDETTQLINRYIQLVTNTVTNYTASSAYFDFDISTCVLEDGYFKQVVSENTGLKFEDGKFKLVMDYADSLNPNHFTLLDVQFYDPLTVDTTKKVAYHLYVPVYTIKQMTYDFYAAVKTGTNSVSYNDDGMETNEYIALLESDWNSDKVHMDSFDTWFTTYLRYGYDMEDINALLSSGNVNWAHEKSAFLITSVDGGAANLPNNACMILVDKNNGNDKAYYATGAVFTKENLDADSKEDIKLELSKFESGGTAFEPVTLGKLIEDKVTAIYKNSGGQPYKLVSPDLSYVPPNDGGVYVCVKNGSSKGWYKYDDNNSGYYDLTVTEDIYEDYYISIYVPDPNAAGTYHLYNVTDPGTLAAPAENTKAKAATIRDTKNYKTLIGNLFAQTTDNLTVKPDEEQITSSNKKINVLTTTGVYLVNNGLGIYLNNTNQDVLHGLNIYLDRYDENGNVENDIQGLEGENRIKAWYSDTPLTESTTGTVAQNIELTENRITVQNVAINKTALKEATAASPYTIYSRVEMTFDDNKLEEEFPEKKGQAGVNVRVTSQIAYDSSTLSTSSMSGEYSKDRHMYYIESLSSASLNYNEIAYTIPEVAPFDEYDEIGKISENYSRLGVNGRDSELSAMPVKTSGTYNASVLSTTDLDKAEYLHLKFALSKKTDVKDAGGNITSVAYGDPLVLKNYLSGEVTFKSGTFEETVTLAENATYVEVYIPKDKWEMQDDIYYIDIDFNVITGEGFAEYANYRIDLQAELIIDRANHVNVNSSEATAYLVYTNAKINHDFLKSK